MTAAKPIRCFDCSRLFHPSDWRERYDGQCDRCWCAWHREAYFGEGNECHRRGKCTCEVDYVASEEQSA